LKMSRNAIQDKYSEKRIEELEKEFKEHEQNGTMTEEIRARITYAIAWHYDSMIFD